MVYKCYQPQAICGFTDDMGRVPGKLVLKVLSQQMWLAHLN